MRTLRDIDPELADALQEVVDASEKVIKSSDITCAIKTSSSQSNNKLKTSLEEILNKVTKKTIELESFDFNLPENIGPTKTPPLPMYENKGDNSRYYKEKARMERKEMEALIKVNT